MLRPSAWMRFVFVLTSFPFQTQHATYFIPLFEYFFFRSSSAIPVSLHAKCTRQSFEDIFLFSTRLILSLTFAFIKLTVRHIFTVDASSTFHCCFSVGCVGSSIGMWMLTDYPNILCDMAIIIINSIPCANWSRRMWVVKLSIIFNLKIHRNIDCPPPKSRLTRYIDRSVVRKKESSWWCVQRCVGESNANEVELIEANVKGKLDRKLSSCDFFSFTMDVNDAFLSFRS